MDLLLHSPGGCGELSNRYARAFDEAVELYVVSAYLTAWDSGLTLSPSCASLTVIVGRDFGITRKKACRDLLRWMPAGKKHNFLVADELKGFHPKAVFWRDKRNVHHAIVGSSNLSNAAFSTNYEANVLVKLSAAQFAEAKAWIRQIERSSIPMSERWLRDYEEASPADIRRGKDKRNRRPSAGDSSIVLLKLPQPRGSARQVRQRRKQLAAFAEHRNGLMRLVGRCARGRISSAGFYEQLPKYWSYELGDRLQGKGWEILGKNSDLGEVCRSLVAVERSRPSDRDDAAAYEIDRLAACNPPVPTRHAFLTEMLCLLFPREYPVLNSPVRQYMAAIGYKPPRGASNGAKYVFMARMLRHSLERTPHHQAKNLAELDSVIWLAYGKKKDSG